MGALMGRDRNTGAVDTQAGFTPRATMQVQGVGRGTEGAPTTRALLGTCRPAAAAVIQLST